MAKKMDKLSAFFQSGVQSHIEDMAGVLDGFWGQYRYILDHRKKSEQKIVFHHGEKKQKKSQILKNQKFSFKINIFSFFSKFFDFQKSLFFLKIFFLHDEIIFFVRIFFCDQVCISSNPRNHLEHLPCPHDDSEPPTRTQFLAKISQIPQIQLP